MVILIAITCKFFLDFYIQMEALQFRQVKQKTKSHCGKRKEKMEVFLGLERLWTKKRTKTF